ncbi:queA: S-adenosylmethionine:tRNA ribosyltransferase-isomerase [Rubrobacter radiotolerans]|uniref:S-adenosylmethionine:tRNA ribosyltransferase-isomerase n=1 Tax=Rubrobacter radiotolerans TaxID=42256 RepID=A0A023X3I8_RUBRA|nr:tRNA preQ1(34) S-adenosylmethionine ribosyltransferase-isomerase QueA [Rubrobacter radiotolerans]AHY46609.1 queA: S-adenosylmethionine:tRNA ribosyltransferase-isomerase [Rubrobacter radiotolerans]MDX5894016.1 tRNA preQ1(34) S-adenosylmethionine ribosyltransferase-isomerase QueA [Rubrobacter radiotolerans]SMC04972.1 S-adenosylmethionine--tRNA ribosyltransferase-isomerase [Rubrobacter radiotolerans DSM 5868]
MKTSDLDYELPEALIAQRPVSPRDASRLMVLDAASGEISHKVFRDLPTYLRSGDALVVNETAVIPARLEARRPGGGSVELLFLRERPEAGGWEALARLSKRLRPGMRLAVGEEDGEELEVLGSVGDGRWTLRVAGGADDVLRLLERHGRAPLPPYIQAGGEAGREVESRYTTVYARTPGSAAAPTAGFHFTEGTLEACRSAGADLARVTLHVGVGTFTPVRTENLTEHRMHAEFYSVPQSAARVVDGARRVVAVGTTVARTLESRAASGLDSGDSELFVYPGYRWRAVDALITNFHLPRSTLLAMVMSFGGEEFVREAYRVAVRERYRFYSFGDAMLILNGGRSSGSATGTAR